MNLMKKLKLEVDSLRSELEKKELDIIERDYKYWRN